MEKEIWKDVKGYEGLYQVNQYGDIFSFYSNKKLKYSLTSDGYKQYILYKDRKGKNVLAHRAVALAFIPNPNDMPMVNHKDENKQNCYYKNLEWCTCLYNNSYNDKEEKIKEKNFAKYAKEFYVYTKSDNNELEFICKRKGVNKFAKEFGFGSSNVSSVLRHNTQNTENLRRCGIYYLSYRELI